MECDNTLIGEKNEPPQRKKVNTVAVLSCCLGIFQVISGLLLRSSAYVADGLNVMAELPFQLQKKKGVFGIILGVIFLVGSLWLATVSFFDTSAVLDYFADCVSLLAIPAAFLSIIVKIIIRIFKKENGETTEKATFDIVVSVVIAVSVILTYLVDFYFEPAVAIAVSTYVFTFIVEKFTSMASERKKAKIRELSEEIQ